MKADLFAATVPVFDRGLAGLSAVLSKGMAHAADNAIAAEELLQARLYADMYPLYRQAQICCDFARQAPSRVLGLEVPPELDGVMDYPQLQAQIADAKQFIAGLQRTQFEGRDDVKLSVPVSGKPMTFPAASYLLGFATPNFYFHLSTAYGILRTRGVALSKPDFFGVGF